MWSPGLVEEARGARLAPLAQRVHGERLRQREGCYPWQDVQFAGGACSFMHALYFVHSGVFTPAARQKGEGADATQARKSSTLHPTHQGSAMHPASAWAGVVTCAAWQAHPPSAVPCSMSHEHIADRSSCVSVARVLLAPNAASGSAAFSEEPQAAKSRAIVPSRSHEYCMAPHYAPPAGLSTTVTLRT